MNNSKSTSNGINVNLNGPSGGNGDPTPSVAIPNDKPEQIKTLGNDVALSEITISEFNGLKDWRDTLFKKDGLPEICDELPGNLTDYMMQVDNRIKDGEKISDFERRAGALNYVFSKKGPYVEKNTLLPGRTSKYMVGAIVYTDTIGYMIWPELKTVSTRPKNPFNISPDVANKLNKKIFPYWLKRRVVMEVARYHAYDTDDYKDDGRSPINTGVPSIDPYLKKVAGVTPKCQELMERMAFFLSDKGTCVSHTVPDFKRLLKHGLDGLSAQIQKDINDLNNKNGKEKEIEFLKGVILMFKGAKTYAENLAKRAEEVGNTVLADICRKVPAGPPETLHEALTSIWICYHLLLQENTNFGFSIGRLDQLLNNYYLGDWNNKTTDDEKKEYTRFAVELVSHFFLNCCDHVPLSTASAETLFAGSGSNQALTVGGVKYLGEDVPDLSDDEKLDAGTVDAVNDMTYIILKATELLSVRDPNVHARYHHRIHNTDANGNLLPEGQYSSYFKRIAQVNINTRATPAIHGDVPVAQSMANYYRLYKGLKAGDPTPAEVLADAFDYASIGCIEQNSGGRHYGNTGSTLFVLPAVLELTLFGGKHRMTGVGKDDPYLFEGALPEKDYKTTPFEDMKSIGEFWKAFETQLNNLAFFAVQNNNYLGRSMEKMRQTPFLSGLFEGPTNTPDSNNASFRDLSAGGAKYNSSGVAVIGLADVIDSFCVIDSLVFQQKVLSKTELLKAMDYDFNPENINGLTEWFNNVWNDSKHLTKDELLNANKKIKLSQKYGKGIEEELGKEFYNGLAVKYTNDLTKLIQEVFFKYRSFRGGRYLVGYWSMTNHAGFGQFSKATPNGRPSKEAFASGITPCSELVRSDGSKITNLDHLKSVAAVDGNTVQNGYTYNLSLTPKGDNSDIVHFANHIKPFMDDNGILVQLCVASVEDLEKIDKLVSVTEEEGVDAATLARTRAELKPYNDFMIRVAGYSAYFVSLSATMRAEIIKRANFLL